MYHLNLLELTEKLFVAPEFQQYDQTLLRRVASNVYYSVFNLLTEDGAQLLLPTHGSARAATRAFSHMEMRKAANRLTEQKIHDPSNTLSGMFEVVHKDQIATLSQLFIDFQQLRHAADYDFSVPIERIEVQQAITEARRFFEIYARLKTTAPDMLKNFIAILLLRKILKAL